MERDLYPRRWGLGPVALEKNPTLTEFCFGMIGRADIEGSRNDVAMNSGVDVSLPRTVLADW
jgi:hypothetical protein